MTMFRMLELELFHSLTQMDPRAVIDLQRRILLLHQRQHLGAVHRSFSPLTGGREVIFIVLVQKTSIIH